MSFKKKWRCHDDLAVTVNDAAPCRVPHKKISFTTWHDVIKVFSVGGRLKSPTDKLLFLNTVQYVDISSRISSFVVIIS